jgi:hypothetical protein
MSLSNLQNSKTVQNHTTSENEIDGLREVVKRDIADASLKALSADRRFATAYNAVLQLSKMAIACAGYRVKNGAGHHLKTFEAVKEIIGANNAENLMDYFDLCRRKRNKIDYDSAEVVTKSEAEELFEKTLEFQKIIEAWIEQNHPIYKSR